MTKRTYNFWVLLQPAPDVPGQWLAHCLDVDVVTQGNSLRDALEMVGEAVIMTILEDMKIGRDPLHRRAPEEFWDALWSLVREGERRWTWNDLTDEYEKHLAAIAAPFVVWLEETELTTDLSKIPPPPAVSPVQWPAVFARMHHRPHELHP